MARVHKPVVASRALTSSFTLNLSGNVVDGMLQYKVLEFGMINNSKCGMLKQFKMRFVEAIQNSEVEAIKNAEC